MFGTPATHPNAVHVPMIPTGCFKSEFDSTYPVHLNGIINQSDFQQSINNINQSISSRKPLLICFIIFIICTVGGMVSIIVGAVTGVGSQKYGFPLLIGIGLGVFLLGMIFMIFGDCILQLRRTTRLRQAVAQESAKYSMRSPTPCSWRLDVFNNRVGGYGNRGNTRIIYRLTIEIGHAVTPRSLNASYQSNQVAPQSPSFFPEPNHVPRSPSYYSQTAAHYCSQCGAPQENLATKFCPSCDQAYNRY